MVTIGGSWIVGISVVTGIFVTDLAEPETDAADFWPVKNSAIEEKLVPDGSDTTRVEVTSAVDEAAFGADSMTESEGGGEETAL